MNRRDFLALVSSSVATGGTISSLAVDPNESHSAIAESRSQARQARPNVVLMICDDLGFGDLGCYGSRLPTPNLDAMAADGVRCTHFNAAHPICSASRAGLLTGRYGTRSGTTGAFGPDSVSGTSLDETLLSSLFRAKGYRNMALGKWHLGNAKGYLPTDRGFDSFYGVPYSIDMKPLPLMRDTTILEADTDRTELTPRYTAEAVKLIEEQRDEPFFLYLGFSYPHDPAKGSEQFRGKTKFGDFGDAVAEIDWSAGEIINAVDRKGLAADTLILFTSDHGSWYQGNPGALRGRKASTFEGGFRVPLIARWKGVIARGKICDDWISSLDVLPSLSKVCGLDPPVNPLDGSDVSAALIDGKPIIDHEPIIYFSPMGERGLDVHCIRRGEWKLRVAQGMDGEVYLNDRTTQSNHSAWLARPELYDVAIDPAESYDVAALNAAIAEDLMRELEQRMQTFPEDVKTAYTELKARKGNVTTPPGAAPRPLGKAEPNWSFEPRDRSN